MIWEGRWLAIGADPWGALVALAGDEENAGNTTSPVAFDAVRVGEDDDENSNEEKRGKEEEACDDNETKWKEALLFHYIENTLSRSGSSMLKDDHEVEVSMARGVEGLAYVAAMQEQIGGGEEEEEEDKRRKDNGLNKEMLYDQLTIEDECEQASFTIDQAYCRFAPPAQPRFTSAYSNDDNNINNSIDDNKNDD